MVVLTVLRMLRPTLAILSMRAHAHSRKKTVLSAAPSLVMGSFDWLPQVDPVVFIRVSPRQELIERSHSPSRGDVMHLRSPPSDPFHKQGTLGRPG